ncbi:hypothetical protein Pcinc_020049 [Petrolisthes cinctipes]|uniref:Uncharacterized protein n=1 Tax=Petrolisthes cinctipes TaxID=88211 RepID=A0AAE1KKB5_PETCI|nr:hypothetical protein Pcinc_020049 [Petrolisthes cinctipes]
MDQINRDRRSMDQINRDHRILGQINRDHGILGQINRDRRSWIQQTHTPQTHYSSSSSSSIRPARVFQQAAGGRLVPSDRVGRQWVLPRKYIGTSRNTQMNTRLLSRARGQSRPSCSNGKVWRRGECQCPYLSQWNEDQQYCTCIYGTYRTQTGHCATY